MPTRFSDGQSVTLSAALENERNLLCRLSRSGATEQMYDELWRDREAIAATILHHLGLTDASHCIVQGQETWVRGQFNICVLVRVIDGKGVSSRKVFRCPMLHKAGQEYFDGAVEEKLRAEVAAYAWIERHCPEIPIPLVHGFGFASDLQFTHRRHLSSWSQWYRFGVQPSRWHINNNTYSHFVKHTQISGFGRPYMLLEYIEGERGTMLSDSWTTSEGHDAERRQTLFRGLSRIMLSLARVPQSHIGSLRFNDDGTLSLSNRPLLCVNSILESEGAPRTIKGPYTSSRAFIDDLLNFRQQAFRHQPNAVRDEDDCRLQMSHMVLLRATQSQFVNSQYEALFALQNPDLHASNIFVDEDWNITAVIDLEFVCSLPVDMLAVPYWLSVERLDDIDECRSEFMEMHNAFMLAFKEEERKVANHQATLLSDVIERALNGGARWFYHSLTSINAMPAMVEDHICREYGHDINEAYWTKLFSLFFATHSEEVVRKKMADRKRYDVQIRALFEEAGDE